MFEVSDWEAESGSCNLTYVCKSVLLQFESAKCKQK